MKLGSLPVIALAACLGAVASGCFFDGGDGSSSGDTNPPPENLPDVQPATVAIDPDAKMTVTPGDGVGVFVEYATGGHWTVTTACDTNTSNRACTFDLFFTPVDPKAVISNPQGIDLAGHDTVSMTADGSLHLASDTSTGLNGVTFDAPEGSNVEMEVYLDGLLEKHFTYWVGDGILHAGTPTNPIDFQPNIPAPPGPSGM
jgi:hypothetical protein